MSDEGIIKLWTVIGISVVALAFLIGAAVLTNNLIFAKHGYCEVSLPGQSLKAWAICK